MERSESNEVALGAFRHDVPTSLLSISILGVSRALLGFALDGTNAV